MKTGKPEVIANMNKNAILQLLRKSGPLSRAQISRRLNMSFPAISSNVRILLDHGLIEEVGEGNNYLGRKSTLLAFNPNKGYVIGVDIGRSRLRVMSSNLSGEVIKSIKIDWSTEIEGEHIIDKVCDAINEIVEMSNIPVKDIMCICIGIPGIRDEQQEKNLLAPFIEGWKEIDIEDRISKEFPTEIIIDNSVNFGAIGEKWKGAARGYKDIVYITYGVGIGAGLILNGELYRGFKNAAGEIGYMTVDKHFLRKYFKDAGSLEELVSGAAIGKNISNVYGGEVRTVEEILNRTDQDDAFAFNIVNDIVIYISMTLVNIVSLINPEIIVLSGRIGKAIFERYNDRIIQTMNAHVPYVPEISLSELDEKANVLGAVAVGIRHANSRNIFQTK
ncbi:MAG: ROK family transcriptional regulator [Clostridia bacterium]|nr:ROK family transcriptional regulator [Clostridia bacterium]